MEGCLDSFCAGFRHRFGWYCLSYLGLTPSAGKGFVRLPKLPTGLRKQSWLSGRVSRMEDARLMFKVSGDLGSGVGTLAVTQTSNRKQTEALNLESNTQIQKPTPHIKPKAKTSKSPNPTKKQPRGLSCILKSTNNENTLTLSADALKPVRFPTTV